MGMHHRFIAALQFQIETAALPVGVLHHVMKQTIPALFVWLRDKARKTPVNKLLAFHAEQPGAGEIDFGDLGFRSQCEIADRGELVQVKITVTRCFQSHMGLAQFFVLHLQFNLMHAQFMQELFTVLCCRFS